MQFYNFAIFQRGAKFNFSYSRKKYLSLRVLHIMRYIETKLASWMARVILTNVDIKAIIERAIYLHRWIINRRKERIEYARWKWSFNYASKLNLHTNLKKDL